MSHISHPEFKFISAWPDRENHRSLLTRSGQNLVCDFPNVFMWANSVQTDAAWCEAVPISGIGLRTGFNSRCPEFIFFSQYVPYRNVFTDPVCLHLPKDAFDLFQPHSAKFDVFSGSHNLNGAPTRCQTGQGIR